MRALAEGIYLLSLELFASMMYPGKHDPAFRMAVHVWDILVTKKSEWPSRAAAVGNARPPHDSNFVSEILNSSTDASN